MIQTCYYRVYGGAIATEAHTTGLSQAFPFLSYAD